MLTLRETCKLFRVYKLEGRIDKYKERESKNNFLLGKFKIWETKVQTELNKARNAGYGRVL